MIGVVIVTHGKLAHEFRAALEHVVGPQEQIETVSIGPNDDLDVRRNDMLAALAQVDSGDGVVVLTDMFGGTPSNLSYAFLEEGHVEVISGVNLPIVIKAIGLRNGKSLAEMAEFLENFGKKSISLASGILKGNKRSQG